MLEDAEGICLHEFYLSFTRKHNGAVFLQGMKIQKNFSKSSSNCCYWQSTKLNFRINILHTFSVAYFLQMLWWAEIVCFLCTNKKRNLFALSKSSPLKLLKYVSKMFEKPFFLHTKSLLHLQCK